jgi:molybdate transport system permease protein
MTESPLTRWLDVLPARKLKTSGPLSWLWLTLLSLPMLVFLGLPLVALLVRIPLADLLAYLVRDNVRQALALSMTTTAVAVFLTIFFGTPIAYLLARRSFRGRTILETLIDLPMVLPPSVAGIALLVAFGRRGLLGQHLSAWGIELAFTQSAVVLAQVFVAAPLYIKAAMTGFMGVERELEDAAALDGAGGWQVFRQITLPLAWTSLFSGVVTTWARALGEFGATIIFAGNFIGRTQTMPLAIYQGFEQDINVAITLSVILLAISFGVLFLVKYVVGQRVN